MVWNTVSSPDTAMSVIKRVHGCRPSRSSLSWECQGIMAATMLMSGPPHSFVKIVDLDGACELGPAVVLHARTKIFSKK